jgi:cell division septation protein DedD
MKTEYTGVRDQIHQKGSVILPRPLKIIIGLILATILMVYGAGYIRSKRLANTNKKRATVAASVTTDQMPLQAEATRQAGAQNAVFYTSVGGSASETPRDTPKSSEYHRFTIEIASVRSQREADGILLSLRKQGLDGFYTPVRRGGEVIYRVRLGVYANPDDAGKALSKLARATQIKGQVAKLQ